MIEVRIPLSNSRVFYEKERYGIRMSYKRPEVGKWLEDHCHHAYWIKGWVTPFDDGTPREIYRSLGHIFVFADADEAMLFKLTWG